MARVPYTRPKGFQPIGPGGPDGPMAIFLPANFDSYDGVCQEDIERWLYGPQSRYELYRDAPGHATPRQKAARIAFYGDLCWICRAAPYEALDHVKPLTKGGSNWPANLRPACQSCNSKKGNKWPFRVVRT